MEIERLNKIIQEKVIESDLIYERMANAELKLKD